MKVGFVGLGLMGQGMVQNISKKFTVQVFTRTNGKAASFCMDKSNIEAIEDISVLARNCNIIVICVTDSPDVVKVARGGVFDNAVWMEGVPYSLCLLIP